MSTHARRAVPIRKGTAKRLGLRRRASVAEFEAVLERCITDMKAAFDPRLITLFDAERAAASDVMESHRTQLCALERWAARSQADLLRALGCR